MKNSVPKHKWALFISLYTTQQIGLAFLLIALIGILRQRGAELGDLSIIYVIGIPWVLKFIWAPVVDRFGYKKWGHYRSWLLVLQLIMVVSLLILSGLSLDTQPKLIIAIGTLFATASATQDVAVDALASGEFDKQHRGLINGIQLAGVLLGSVIGGGLVLILYPYIGWQGAFYLMAGVTSLSWFQLLIFHEKNFIPAQKALSITQTFKRLFVFWRGKRLWFLLVVTSTIGYTMIYGILTPLMLDAGKTLADVGIAINVFGTSVGVLTGLMAGWLIHRLGRKRALQGFYLFQVICFVTILPVVFQMNNITLYFALLIYYITYPLIASILATLMMDYAAQGVTPGTDYTIQYTLAFFAGNLMASIGLQIAQRFGYHCVILVAIGIAILALILAMTYTKKMPNHIHIEHKTKSCRKKLNP